MAECLTVAGKSRRARVRADHIWEIKGEEQSLTGLAWAWLSCSLRWEGFGELEVEECRELTCLLTGHLACFGCCRPEQDKA